MLEPHYNKLGEFVDPCIVCGFNRCRREHADGWVILTEVMLKARGRITQDYKVKFKEKFWTEPDPMITRPEEMGMAEHWLKGFINENLKKGMPLDEATLEAYKRVRKLVKRNQDGKSNILTPRGWQRREKPLEEISKEKWGF